jgi:hypothetical protein
MQVAGLVNNFVIANSSLPDARSQDVESQADLELQPLVIIPDIFRMEILAQESLLPGQRVQHLNSFKTAC